MAGIYADSTGNIQAFYSSWEMEQNALSASPSIAATGGAVSSPSLPGVALLAPGAAFAVNPKLTNIVDFDESTNAALVADIIANPLTYAAPTVNAAPQLQKNGTPAVITAPSEMYSARTTILAGITEATIEQAVTALWAGTATTAQSQKAVAYLCVKLRIAGII